MADEGIRAKADSRKQFAAHRMMGSNPTGEVQQKKESDQWKCISPPKCRPNLSWHEYWRTASMTGYDFRPEAEIDVDLIWEYIAGDNLGAADRMIERIRTAIESLVTSPGSRSPATPASHLGRCVS